MPVYNINIVIRKKNLCKIAIQKNYSTCPQPRIAKAREQQLIISIVIPYIINEIINIPAYGRAGK